MHHLTWPPLSVLQQDDYYSAAHTTSRTGMRSTGIGMRSAGIGIPPNRMLWCSLGVTANGYWSGSPPHRLVSLVESWGPGLYTSTIHRPGRRR